MTSIKQISTALLLTSSIFACASVVSVAVADQGSGGALVDDTGRE